MKGVGAMRGIAELAEAVRADPDNNEPLVNAFIEGNTFPMLDKDTAVFVYAKPNTEEVFLRHWVFGLESKIAMLKLEGTELWYLPLELPHGARVEYKLEVITPSGRRLVRDPYNDKHAFDPFGANSVVAMPGYTDPEWAQPDERSRKGRIISFKVDSNVWGDTRDVDVYLPSEYKPHKRYSLLICHDGPDYRRFANIVEVLDNLIYRNEVAPLVVVFTAGVNRNVEYGAHEKHPEFIVKELLPAVRARFAISDNPEDIGLMGASFGGVATLWTAWNHPGVFGKLLVQSGSFVFTDVGTHDRGPLWDPVVAFVNEFRTDPAKIDAQVYQSCGTFESLIWFNRGLAPLMRDAGLKVRFVEAQDGHNWFAWRDRLREGLTWLFPGRLWMTYE